MAVFSITYVLQNSKDELSLKNGIDLLSFGLWIKPMPFQFVIKSSYTADQILNILKNHTGARDVLFVSKLDQPHWASINIDAELMNNLKRLFF